MPLQKETVAIPFVSGIQPATRGRLLDPAKLLVAENCQYVVDQGPQKRYGHVGRVVRSSKDYIDMEGMVAPTPAPPRETFSTANPGLHANWLYGWGVRDPNSSNGANFSSAPGFVTAEYSPFPDVGQLFGQATRDNEILTWDGFRLFSYTPQLTSKFGETLNPDPLAAISAPGLFCAPALRVTPMAKVATSQTLPDACDNGVLRLVVWTTTATSFSYSVFNSKTGATLVNSQLVSPVTQRALRCISVGAWFHILSANTGANQLELRSFHQDSPTVVNLSILGTVDNNLDVKKIDETRFAVLHSKGTVLTVTVLNADASVVSAFNPASSTPATNSPLCLGIDSLGNIAVAYQSGAGPFTTFFRLFNQGGATLASHTVGTTVNVMRRLTMAPKLVANAGFRNFDLWRLYLEFTSSGTPFIDGITISPGAGTSTLTETVPKMILGSHAFSVGNKTFVWCASWTAAGLGFQTTWFLCDEELRPVGKMFYGLANPDLTFATYSLRSVNWHTDDTARSVKDRIVFHGAASYNQRVPTASPSFSPSGVFAEPSVAFYELDFLPKLRSAQAGRTTYFAGAQLWAYDGAQIVEAGFHMAPEGVTGVAAGAAGSLSAGTYRYRVDLCHKNAQNEEVRSWSLITAGITAVANNSITLDIPTMPMTRKSNSYFLVYRTEANGTVYRLVSSRDPTSASFVNNARALISVSLVDGLSDAAILSREYHPANAGGNYLDPLPAPACEIVAAGRNRLWLAGGELAPGELAPSRLFQPGETPAFSPGLNIQVDRNFEPITAVGFLGELAAVFRRTNAYIIDSDGPDNSLNGAWAPPRLAIADTGCVAQETLALTVHGLWFQAPPGLRLLNNSGRMDPQAGMDVDPLASVGNYSGAVVVPQNTQVRWYSRDNTKPSLILDYSSNTWVTWTGLTCVGASFWSSTNYAVLSRGDGFIWEEAPTIFTDFGSSFETRMRLSWLHAGQLGDFQRIRRFALFGECGRDTTIRGRVFYDERPFHDEEFFVTTQSSTVQNAGDPHFNDSEWGVNATWGDLGPWGDDSTSFEEHGSSLWFRDGVFKFRHRPTRQKCSVFSLEFSDMGTNNAGFVPVVLAIELAKKPGLDRIPTP